MSLRRVPLAAVLLFSLVSASVATAAQPSPSTVTERKIVVFKNEVSNDVRQQVLQKHGLSSKSRLDLTSGEVAELPRAVAERLKEEPGVLRIDDDAEAHTMGVRDTVEALRHRLRRPSPTPKPTSSPTSTPSTSPSNQPNQPGESIPWGISKIGADQDWSKTTADTIKVGVIDTGIDIGHPDLNANIKGSYNALNTNSLAQDDNGHGSHVAGTIAAVDNTIGVVGAGPQIDLYAIKVLNAHGSGYVSDIIKGINWAIDNKVNVINMSLGTTSDVQSLRDAVARAKQAGIVVVAAAGNGNGGSVNYPGAYPEVVAVSATDSNNTIANFSSVGPQVSLAAPGVNIPSTYKGSGYQNMSGTSMATPHVAGTAALVMSRSSSCDANHNGSCDPDEVRNRLQNTAQHLGSSGKNNQYGYGLVDAKNAINAANP